MAGRQKRRARLEAEKRLAEAQKRIADRKDAEKKGIKLNPEDEAIRVDVERIRNRIDDEQGDIQIIWRSDYSKIDNPNSIPDELFIEAALRSFGNVSIMSRMLGCYNKHVYYRINHCPALAEVMAESNNSIVDLAKARLLESLAKGENWAIQFTLETLGKSQGFTKEIVPEDNKGSILGAINRMLDGKTIGE